jgi:hypothetical protein
MKVHIEMDMSPEEARTLLGLPDIAPLQRQMVEEMQNRMKTALEAGDPEAMMKAWMAFLDGSGGAKAFEQFQKFLWDGARMASGAKAK